MKRTMILPWSLLFGLLCFDAAWGQTASNAQIINSSVNCRSHPPKFSPSTLVTFKFKLGDAGSVLQAGTRVQALSRSVVGTNDEWFQVTTGKGQQCWIYVGKVGQRRYIKLDSGVALSHAAPIAEFGGILAAWLSAIPSAAAQSSSTAVAAEPVPTVKPLLNMLIAALGVGIFVGSLVCLKRFVFPNSNVLVWITSMSVLLLLGVLSESTFASILTQFLAQSK